MHVGVSAHPFIGRFSLGMSSLSGLPHQYCVNKPLHCLFINLQEEHVG